MAKIRVLRNYGGRLTNEARILPGVYNSDDERLFGLAEYLVAEGYAVSVPAPKPEEAPPEAEVKKLAPRKPARRTKKANSNDN